MMSIARLLPCWRCTKCARTGHKENKSISLNSQKKAHVSQKRRKMSLKTAMKSRDEPEPTRGIVLQVSSVFLFLFRCPFFPPHSGSSETSKLNIAIPHNNSSEKEKELVCPTESAFFLHLYAERQQRTDAVSLLRHTAKQRLLRCVLPSSGGKRWAPLGHP